MGEMNQKLGNNSMHLKSMLEKGRTQYCNWKEDNIVLAKELQQ